MTNEQWLNAAKAWQKKGEEIRSHLHKHPELSFNESNTAKFITEQLINLGLTPRTEIGGHGIITELDSGKPGPVICLRADMDALPIEEQTNAVYKSVNSGIMHACGHDVHMACLLGAIEMLLKHKEHWQGKCVFLFQPAEEQLPGGATQILETGILQSYNPAIMLALHVYPELEAGKVGFRPGPYMASTDELHLTLHGTGGHAALPHKLTDPLMAAAQLVINWQQIPSRLAPATIPTVLSVGSFEAKGATNVIPNKVELKGTFRTFDETWRTEAHEHIQRIAEQTAALHNVSLNLEIRKGYPCLVNHKAFTETAQEIASDLLGSENVIQLDLRTTAEDFAWYGLHFPIVFFRLGTAGENKTFSYPVHHPEFDINPKAIPYGVASMSWLVRELSVRMPF
jgi:amidohydrolase